MDDKSKIITMRDAPVKKFIAPQLSKPLTTHDIYKPVSDYPENPKEPGGPLITTGNVDKIQEQAAMRARMEKARTAKMEKIKEELQAKKAKEAKKAKSEKKAPPAEKKEPESPPEVQPEAPETSDIPEKEVKPDPLKEAVDKANKPTSTRKSYTTKKKEEPKDKK